MKKKRLFLTLVSLLMFVLLACSNAEPNTEMEQARSKAVEVVDCSKNDSLDPELYLYLDMTIVDVNIEEQYICVKVEDEIVKLTVESFNKWEHYSFVRDEHGLTGRDEWRIEIGQIGTLMRRDQYESDGRYYLVGKTFDEVYGSDQDIRFEKVWREFRSEVIKTYDDIISIPMWMRNETFSADFSPQDACWWAKEYSYSVRIDSDFEFCQYDHQYNGYSHVNITGWYIYAGVSYEDDTSLISVLPNKEDKPTVLEIGENNGNGLVLVACLPVEGYLSQLAQTVDGEFERDQIPFFRYSEKRYTGVHFTEDLYYVSPIGVVFEINGEVAGDIVPYNGLLEYITESPEGEFGYYLYKLSTECLK